MVLKRVVYGEIPITDAANDDIGACVWRSAAIAWTGPGEVSFPEFFWYLTSQVPIDGSNMGDWGAVLWHNQSNPNHLPMFFSTWLMNSENWKCLGRNTLIKVADVGTGVGIGNIHVEPWWP